MPDHPSAVYLISGSRHWLGSPALIRASLARFRRTYPDRHCVLYVGDCAHPSDGHGQSVDMLAQGLARELGFEVVVFRADWEKLGKAAVPIRNSAMCRTAAAREADGAVVEVHAWPGADSKGTPDCLRAAKECGLHGLEHVRRNDA